MNASDGTLEGYLNAREYSRYELLMFSKLRNGKIKAENDYQEKKQKEIADRAKRGF